MFLKVLAVVLLVASVSASADWFYQPTEWDRKELQKLLQDKPSQLSFYRGEYEADFRQMIATLKKRGYRTAKIAYYNRLKRLLIVRTNSSRPGGEVLIRDKQIVEVTYHEFSPSKAAR